MTSERLRLIQSCIETERKRYHSIHGSLLEFKIQDGTRIMEEIGQRLRELNSAEQLLIKLFESQFNKE